MIALGSLMNSPPTLNLHHIGYAVSNIEPIASTYVSRYGYQLSTPIIHDPLQTAFVQFLRLRGDSSYLEFVAPDSPESKLANVVKLGTGIHHLCFVSGPLESTIAHLEQMEDETHLRSQAGYCLRRAANLLVTWQRETAHRAGRASQRHRPLPTWPRINPLNQTTAAQNHR